jgi:hypothetical protein
MINPAAHTPPHRLSTVSGESMNQFAGFENCNSPSQIAKDRAASSAKGGGSGRASKVHHAGAGFKIQNSRFKIDRPMIR